MEHVESKPSAQKAMNEEGSDQEGGPDRPSLASTQQSDSQVSFGTVNVHKHRMTLGQNPAASGIPVELAWEEWGSETLDVDEFEKARPDKAVHRIAKTSRERIAEEGHSRESILHVQEEMEWIKKSREASEGDEDRKWRIRTPTRPNFSRFWRK